MGYWTITQIASVVLCAMGSGLVLSSFGYTPVLGYIIAGIILGPSGFKFIHDRDAVLVFSEMGILFLLFAIGLSLSFERIKTIWKSSFSIMLLSTVFIYMVVALLGYFFKFSHPVIVLITFCVTLSSTAVTVKSLAHMKEKDESIEHNTYGVLIAQDLAALVMVLCLNIMSPATKNEYHFKNIVIASIFFICVIFYFTRYHRYIYKFTNFIKKHQEMLSLIVFGMCLGGAVLAELSGLSAPFGAFLIGLILGNSNLKDDIKGISITLEEILLMTFFLSVGLLVDLKFILANWVYILFSLLLITVGKTVINVFVFRLCRFPLRESFVVSVLLGHIGEFSFMLAFAAKKSCIINDYGVNFLVSLTALSLFVSPFWMIFAERCKEIAQHVACDSSMEFLKLASGNNGIFYRKVIAFFKALFHYAQMSKSGIQALIENRNKFKNIIKEDAKDK